MFYMTIIISFKPWKLKFFFQFEIVIYFLVSSSRFMWIHMLWVYDHYKVQSSTLDVRFWRLKSVTALKGLNTKAYVTLVLLEP